MDIDRFEDMLRSGQDNALIRFTMGSAFFQHKKYEQALPHLQQAVTMDQDYSAAWKLYGRCLEKLERPDEARDIYRQGLAVAEARGDMQTVREIRVFLKRLQET